MILCIFNGCIFKIIRSDIQEINHLQTSGFYRINFVTNKGNKESYLSTSKRKLATSIKENKRDIKLINRILQQKILKRNFALNIGFKNRDKFNKFNFNNLNHALFN